MRSRIAATVACLSLLSLLASASCKATRPEQSQANELANDRNQAQASLAELNVAINQLRRVIQDRDFDALKNQTLDLIQHVTKVVATLDEYVGKANSRIIANLAHFLQTGDESELDALILNLAVVIDSPQTEGTLLKIVNIVEKLDLIAELHALLENDVITPIHDVRVKLQSFSCSDEAQRRNIWQGLIDRGVEGCAHIVGDGLEAIENQLRKKIAASEAQLSQVLQPIATKIAATDFFILRQKINEIDAGPLTCHLFAEQAQLLHQLLKQKSPNYSIQDEERLMAQLTIAEVNSLYDNLTFPKAVSGEDSTRTQQALHRSKLDLLKHDGFRKIYCRFCEFDSTDLPATLRQANDALLPEDIRQQCISNRGAFKLRSKKVGSRLFERIGSALTGE